MHDIDRTQTALGYEGYEMDPYSSGEAPYSGGEPAFAENEENQLAAQLMEVNTEDEFENFLGDLISQAAKAVGGYITSQTGQSLGSLLKGAARQILPVIQQALSGPGAPGAPGQEFEAQLEAQEWEAARTFVRLAQEASKTAALSPPAQDPATTAHAAVVDAAQKVAPALVAPSAAPPMPAPAPHAPHAPGCACQHHHRHQHGHHAGSQESGHWVRHGDKIILFGI